MHMFSIKVEYYRSLEYFVKWKGPMNPTRNLKWRKNSPSEDSLQRKMEGKRQQKWRKKAQSGKQSDNDILDLIARSHEHLPEETGPLVEVANEGVDQSDDDQVSVSSSVKSGPSCHYNPCADKPLTLCPACRKLQLKAKRMKEPHKDKLLDTNPKSLTCDQWVLLKPWRSKKKFDSRGNLLGLVKLIHKLVEEKKSKKKNELWAGDMCSRPHVFLQRNLLHWSKKPVMERKKNRRKRVREDSQGTRVAKQKRTHNNHQPISNSLIHNTEPIRNCFSHNSSLDSMSSPCSTSSLESGPVDSDLMCRLPPVSVSSEASDSFKEVPTCQIVSKRGGGFKDLLAQLRGNNSMIIKEIQY